jgi:N-acetylglucosaminyldiphosphoundecaprenol N-acetyl-beta-D-mannosaminyltransferase
MKKYFNIFIEFDRVLFNSIIEENIESNRKGYVCVIDGNVLANASKNNEYKKIINSGLVNSCDGSSIALIAGKIHKQSYKTYTGPEIFSDYVKKDYKQYFLGNTNENLERLKKRFIEYGYSMENFRFESLPFMNVEEFDYQTIAKSINEFSPEFIWISLGAPKQEFFINKLYPFIKTGILFAIGAAINLYLGDLENKRAPNLLRKMHLEWLYRAIQEPKRVGKRALNYFLLLPNLIFIEFKQSKTYKY